LLVKLVITPIIDRRLFCQTFAADRKEVKNRRQPGKKDREKVKEKEAGQKSQHISKKRAFQIKIWLMYMR